jgi:putative hydrolase of the HAD superfamily
MQCDASQEETAMKEKIQAVIFDMYETLVTQFCSPLYYGTQIAQDLDLAPEVFLPDWRKTEADRATGKRTFEEVIQTLMRQHGIRSSEKYRQVVKKRIAIQEDCFRHLHPEILPMLTALKEKGIKIGLITNCFSEESKLIRESVLFPWFDVPCLSYELGIRKPDPAIFRACLEALGIPARNCLYVGDGGSQELEAARDAGMQALQATWYRQKDFETYQAAIRQDFIQVSQPMKLLDFLPKSEWNGGCK